MAVSPTYQSSQTAFSATTTLTITKPVSLAVGDLMVAHIAIKGEGGTASLSGWTQKIATQDPNTGSAGLTSIILYKIADSNDVAATNFSFTTNDAPSSGAISRFTGIHATTPLDQAHGSAGLGDTGITPTLANSLVLIFASTKDSDGAFISTGSYAVTNGNPGTWNEAYDYGNNSGGVGYSIAMAYGARSSVSATGNVTLTADDSISFGVTQIVNLPFTGIEAVSGTFTIPTHLATFVAPVIGLTYTLNAPTLTDLSGGWTRETKSTTEWTNVSKS